MSNPYLESLLGDNEKILLATRQHWFVFVRTILLESLVIAVILATVTVAYTVWNRQYGWLLWAYWLLVVPVISFIYDYFQWRNREYVLTDFRVIQISGIINKNVIDSSLEKVNDVKLTQSFFGRIFNFGTVEIMTASELGINKIDTLENPIRFKTTMVNAKEALEYGNGRRGAPPVVPNIATDIPSMIAQLDNLRQQGLLTPEEFQAKKAELLKRM